ncbi:MAG: glycosyltransferase family protein [Candidatus Omnitrophica bacterium]|nr:glycosyltransferase family protein [Candidatus Omnitrophota bacterium]
MKSFLVKDLLLELSSKNCTELQKSPEYLEWVGPNIADMANEFVLKHKLTDSYFIKRINSAFKTNRFETLLKRWLVTYLWDFLSMLDDFVVYGLALNRELILEDLPLNRFGVEKYCSKFGVKIDIKWTQQSNVAQRAFSIILKCLSMVWFSVNNGFRAPRSRKKYKVMREAVWGLYDVGGYFFHDDFFVDGAKIKKEDLLLFSRGIPWEPGRFKGYQDAQKSPYKHFDPSSLSIGISSFCLRIIPKYIISGSIAIFKEIRSSHFSLHWSVYLCFIHNALPYEKIFSHFEITSELGHNYFSVGHIPEAIVCENHGTKYYLMHWSDHSIPINKFLISFLGCDKFLSWGRAHTKDAGLDSACLLSTGYVFKKFIKETASKRDQILREMGITAERKIITFFDESFGGRCKMTGENYVMFWETILKFTENNKDNVVFVKTKWLSRADHLPNVLKQRFIDIKNKLAAMADVHIIDSFRWSFIDYIGISDVVITQGMTSSSTIAIICGIPGLYLDQAQYDHPFSKALKGKVVFDEPRELLSMIEKILAGLANPFNYIPEVMLRTFDEYPDDRGIDLFRDVLVGMPQKRVGIIVQARMGSTRLPGKALKTISGKPMLEILVNRLKRCKNTNLLIVATTVNKNDDAIELLANDLGVECFRGDEEDVLSRYHGAAKRYGLDVIVRVTSDCPLMDPSLVDALVMYYTDNIPVDYVSNTLERTYPRGFDIEVFSSKALEDADRKASKRYQREHVTPFIYENMKCLNYASEKNAAKYRVTVDTIEDLKLVASVFDLLKGCEGFGYRQVIDLLDSKPELAEMNKHVEQKKVAI